MIASFLLPVPDKTPPTTAVLATPGPNAAGWNTSAVTLAFSATDNTGGSGLATIHYDVSGPQSAHGDFGGSASLQITAEGVSTVTYYATDVAGNAEPLHTLVVRIDSTAPVIAVPAPITVDATTPAGASVTYVVTATDNSGLVPVLACSPLSGATHAIGTSTVSCTATDAAGNSAAASFTVSVRGVPEQLVRLVFTLSGLDSKAMPPGLANALQNTFDALLHSGNKTAFCQILDNVGKQAAKSAGKGDLPADRAAAIVADTIRIGAVQGCP
jgi:hypothetical protein